MFEVDYIPSEKPLFNLRLCTNKRLNRDQLPSCAGRGSRELADKIESLLLEQSIPAKLIRSPCMNNCQIGPNLKIQGAGLYNGVTEDGLAEIIEAIKAEVERRKALSEQNQ
jgi:NADH:ubiquinone oxidoreductase subunit E